MTRTLRGAWDRRSVLVPLLAVAAIAVAGAANVIAFVDGVGVRTAFAAPILLLAVLAVPAVARDLAIARRPEIGQARMRGVHGLRLTILLVAEPLLVLVLGGLVGLALGRGAALASGAVLDLVPGPLGANEAWLVAGVVGGGLVAVLVGMAATAREPLARQLGTPVRRPSGSFLTLFAQLLVLCAAAVACYQAGVADPADATSGGGWLLLAGPALVGLAVGMVAVWLVRAIAGVFAGARREAGDRGGGSLAGFLAVRRIARGTDLNSALGFVVAASVVVAVAASGQHAIGAWTDQTAKLRAGAPLQVEVPGGALAALEISRRVDPEGRWLMAGVVVDQGGPDRYAYLDTERYPRVVGDFLDDTPAGGLVDEVAGLAADVADSRSDAATVSVVHADELEVRIVSGDPAERWYLAISYVNDEDYTDEVQVPRGIPADGRLHTIRLPRCNRGCSLTGITSDPNRNPLVVTHLQAGDVDLLAGGWSVESGKPLEQSADGMVLPTRRQFVVLRPIGVDAAVPVLVAGPGPEDDEVITSGGNRRTATVLGHHDALPLLEAHGALGDLPRALVGASQTGRGSRAVVLARADTPDEVLAELPGEPNDPDALGADLADEVGAERGDVYLLVGLWSLLLALPVLASATARARRNQRQEAAALRVSGVGVDDIRAAGRRQWAILAANGVAAALVGGVAAAWLLPDGLHLVAVPAGSVSVPGWVSWPVLAGGVATLVLLLAAASSASRRREASSRPAVLREEATR